MRKVGRACARTRFAHLVWVWWLTLTVLTGGGCSASPVPATGTDVEDVAIGDGAVDGQREDATGSESDSTTELADSGLADSATVDDVVLDAGPGDDDAQPDTSLQDEVRDAAADPDSGSALPALIDCLQAASYVREFRLPAEVNELSGLATARVDGAAWWMHNDSGGEPLIYGVSAEQGVVTTRRFAESARDVEDMAAGLCGDGVSRCLYVADIGDNLAVHASVRIHRVAELDSDIQPQSERMTLRYATGAVDAEALFVRGQQVVVMTKEPGRSRVFAVDFEAGADLEVSEIATLSLEGLPAGASELLTAADWHPESGLLLRTYTTVAWVPLADDAPLSVLGEAVPVPLPVGLDLQGESIAWFDDGAGYFHAGEGRDVRSYAVRCELESGEGSGPP